MSSLALGMATKRMRPEGAPELDSERVRCGCGNPGVDRDVWRGNASGVRTIFSVAPFRANLF
jgi:hypothetical protein